MKGLLVRSALCGAAVSALLMAGAASGQTPAQFYANKQMKLIIGNSAGGDYDNAGRLLARHITRHIPGNPTMIVQNMQGASTVVATNFLYSVAPKDGTVIGSFSRNIPSQAALGRGNIKADPRQFGWIGGLGLLSRVCTVWHTAPLRSIQDVFEKEGIFGGSGSGSSLSIVPAVLNNVLGTKFKVVEGYSGSAEVIIAMERQEVHGICHTYTSFKGAHADMIEQKKVRVLFNTEEAPFTELPNIPSIYQYANDEQKQYLQFAFSSVEFGRPYVAPPGLPADRLQALRAAFDATVKDAMFLEDAQKQNLDVTFRPSRDLEALVANLFATPPATLEKIKAVMPDTRD